MLLVVLGYDGIPLLKPSLQKHWLEQNTTVIIFKLNAGVTNPVGVPNFVVLKVITFREVKTTMLVSL